MFGMLYDTTCLATSPSSDSTDLENPTSVATFLFRSPSTREEVLLPLENLQLPLRLRLRLLRRVRIAHRPVLVKK